MSGVEYECRMAWLDAYVAWMFKAYHARFPLILRRQPIVELSLIA